MYKNVVIEEAKIAKILNFGVAIFRNILLVPFILFICIKVLSFNYKYYNNLSNMDETLFSQKIVAVFWLFFF